MAYLTIQHSTHRAGRQTHVEMRQNKTEMILVNNGQSSKSVDVLEGSQRKKRNNKRENHVRPLRAFNRKILITTVEVNHIHQTKDFR